MKCWRSSSLKGIDSFCQESAILNRKDGRRRHWQWAGEGCDGTSSKCGSAALTAWHIMLSWFVVPGKKWLFIILPLPPSKNIWEKKAHQFRYCSRNKSGQNVRLCPSSLAPFCAASLSPMCHSAVIQAEYNCNNQNRLESWSHWVTSNILLRKFLSHSPHHLRPQILTCTFFHVLFWSSIMLYCSSLFYFSLLHHFILTPTFIDLLWNLFTARLEPNDSGRLTT